MKALHGLGFAVVGTLLSSGVWLACSSNNNNGGSSSGDGGSSSTSSVATSSGSTGTSSSVTTSSGSATTGDAGDSGADAADGNVTCAVYCADIVSACGTAKGSLYAQYQSLEECLTACPLLRASSDPLVNNIGCRDQHAHYAMPMDAGGLGLPDPHCWHAGPYGYSVCGDPCKSFCTLDTDFCSPDAGTGFDGMAPYPSNDACEAKCPTFPVLTPNDAGVFLDAGFTAWSGTGNTLDCREYHILNAMNTDPTEGGSTGAPNVHCGHTASISLNGVCGDGG